MYCNAVCMVILAELESKINNLLSFKIKAAGSNHKLTEGLLLKEIPVKEYVMNKTNVKPFVVKIKLYF